MDDQDDDKYQDIPTPAESAARQYKRKHQDINSSDSSGKASDDEEIPIKANKVNRNAGRPRALDYEDLVKEFILLVAMIYRCLLSMEDAFPDLAVELDMVKEAWATVIDETSGPPLALTPDIAKIVSDKLLLGDILIVFQIKARGSQAHGKIKDKTRPLVEGLYGFDSSHGRKAMESNHKLAEELKHERGFIYKVHISFLLQICLYWLLHIKTISIESAANDTERKGMFQHPIIQQ